MHCLRRVITTSIRRYPSPGRFEPRARAYSSLRSSLRPVWTARYATIRPIDAATGLRRLHGTARAQGCVVGRDESRGSKHERRRIGKCPHLPLHLHRRSLLYHPMMSACDGPHSPTMLSRLHYVFAVLAEHTFFWLGGGAGATLSVYSAPSCVFTTPLPDSASSPPTADPVPPGSFARNQ